MFYFILCCKIKALRWRKDLFVLGQKAMERAIEIVKDENKCDKSCRETIEEYQQRVISYPSIITVIKLI